MIWPGSRKIWKSPGIEGCWDLRLRAGWPDTPEEIIRAEVRKCIDSFAPGGGFVFWASTYGAPDDEVQSQSPLDN